MRACYNLSRHINGFDFYNWIQLAIRANATEIVFNIKKWRTVKWTERICRKRFNSIILPGPELFNLPHSFGDDEGSNFDTAMGGVVLLAKKGWKPVKFKSILPPGNEKYTITIRSTQRESRRNSNEKDWRIFAEEIGAFIIEDYGSVKISLYERLALYAGAKMNFFVTNGPGLFCSYTDYPMMSFDLPKDEICLRHNHVKFGEKLPWMGGNQHFIWEPDNLNNMRKNFEKFCK